MPHQERREYLYGEHNEDGEATRMIRADRYKLIWYPVGNRLQLFDVDNDPQEMQDLSGAPDYADIRVRLTELLVENLYGCDLDWVQDGKLIGTPDKEFVPAPNRNLNAQRGWR